MTFDDDYTDDDDMGDGHPYGDPDEGGGVDDDFDYEQFVAREFGDGVAADQPGWIRWTAIVVIVALVLPLIAAAVL